MVTVDDLSPKQELPEPMTVTVTDVNRNAGRSRRAWVELEDSVGTSLYLVDYEGANISINWTRDFQYRISRCRVNKGRDGYKICLESSKKTEIEELGPVEDIRKILIIGDTHVGRSRHPGDRKPIDPVGCFRKAVKYGISHEVDAVIHVGDVFHDTADYTHTAVVSTKIMQPLKQADIPFCYVEGNHECEPGNRLLTNTNEYNIINLGTTGTVIAPGIRAYGINHHEMGNIPRGEVQFSPSKDDFSILVLHQTLKQLSGAGSKSVDLNWIANHTAGKFNYVISGHHHDAKWKSWKGIPIMYPGATARLSKNSNPIDKVAWLLEIENGTVSRKRYDIQ